MTLCCQRDNFLKVKRNHPIILDVARNHAHQMWVHTYSIVFEVWPSPWFGVLATRVNLCNIQAHQGASKEGLTYGKKSKSAHRSFLSPPYNFFLTYLFHKKMRKEELTLKVKQKISRRKHLHSIHFIEVKVKILFLFSKIT